MTLDQALAISSLLGLGLAGLWTVYGLLSSRIDSHNADLAEVKHNYVRRDDFLRVIDRFEAKLDKHLEIAATRDRPQP